MAFEKKPLQSGVKEFLEDYSVDLENRVDSGFNKAVYTVKNPNNLHCTIRLNDSDVVIQSGLITTNSASGPNVTATIPQSDGNSLMSATVQMVHTKSFVQQYNNISEISVNPNDRTVRVYGLENFPSDTQFDLYYIAIFFKE